MLILEEFWSRNGYLQHTPIYTISGIAARALGIYQTYIEMMGEDIKQAFAAVRVCGHAHCCCLATRATTWPHSGT